MKEAIAIFRGIVGLMILLASGWFSTIRAQEIYDGRCDCRKVVSPYAVERTSADGGTRMPGVQPISSRQVWTEPHYGPAGYMHISRYRPTILPAGYSAYAPIAPRIGLAHVTPGYSGAVMESAASPYYVGLGVLGQRKLFASGQPLRNVVRFITP